MLNSTEAMFTIDDEMKYLLQIGDPTGENTQLCMER